MGASPRSRPRPRTSYCRGSRSWSPSARAGAAFGCSVTCACTCRRWRTTTEELLYARQRLEQRMTAAGIDAGVFRVQREKAEGEALNPKTAKFIAA